MKKLDKLIIKTFVGPFIATFFVTLFVLIMQFVWKYIDDLVGKGLDTPVIVELLVYTSASLVPLAMPLAVLLSSIMTFGNLGESFELVAIKSAGISLLRFIRPLFFFSALIAVGAFLFANYIIPIANLRAKSLLYDITQSKPAFNIKQGVFYSDIPGYVIKVAKKDPDNKTIHQVMIYDRSPNGGTSGNERLILAEKGTMELSPDKRYLNFTLENGWRFEERDNRSGRGGNELIRLGFKTYIKPFDLKALAFDRLPLDAFASNQQMLNIRQLDEGLDSLRGIDSAYIRTVHAYVTTRYPFYKWKDTGWLASAPPLKVDNFLEVIPEKSQRYVLERVESNLRETEVSLASSAKDFSDNQSKISLFKVEWQRKFSLAAACVVMFLIGAPLGSIIRKGGLGTPLVFAVIFFVIFNIFFMTGEKMARKDVMASWSGMWLANIVLLPIAGFLVYKAMNDSNLFNKEAYYRAFQTFKKYFRRRQSQHEISR
ncbi:LptF/LptG family permease [Chitinophaga sp. GCM10012297]|uniref:LptF/LptG family permease n=1 Tax=Chitinophaga chungangae TaxID=2821488 RepID=A0ABS3YCD3_9BACT|nr:LptF/LptG family permease [Chitinophaga chungangae]MBO9152343.1 LptF/LptG family permease [Chitinophaga chungangae]